MDHESEPPRGRADSDPPPSEDDRGEHPESEFPRPGETDNQAASRKRLESAFRELVRRGVEKGINAGVGTWTKTDSAFRDIVGDVKLPKEIVSYVFSSVDDTKNALVRVVAKEVRDFLDATDVAQEIKKALTSLSFEVKTEIRFIPNDAGGVRPDVKARIAKKKKAKPPEDEEEEADA